MIGHTGLRRGELAGLTWQDVDLEACTITVQRTRVSVGYQVYAGEAKSDAGQERAIPLDADTVEILKAHRKRQLTERLAAGEAYEPGDWVVADELGRPVHPETVSKTFKRLAQRAGLPSTKLHGLRHFLVAAMISSGKDLGTVSKLAGHSSVQVTAEVYGGLFDTAARDATEGVAALVRGSEGGTVSNNQDDHDDHDDIIQRIAADDWLFQQQVDAGRVTPAEIKAREAHSAELIAALDGAAARPT